MLSSHVFKCIILLWVRLSFLAEVISNFESYIPLIGQIGGGGVIGFIIGYAVKKIFKILIVLGGLALLGLLYLSHFGYLTINWEKFSSAMSTWIEKLTLTGGLTGYAAIIASNLPFAGAFITGIALGLKAG